MPTASVNQAEVERVLVEVTSLLLERARIELEREVEAAGDSATADAVSNLLRMRELEDALRTIRQARAVAAPARVPLRREVSKFYEVPGQEDA